MEFQQDVIHTSAGIPLGGSWRTGLFSAMDLSDAIIAGAVTSLCLGCGIGKFAQAMAGASGAVQASTRTGMLALDLLGASAVARASAPTGSRALNLLGASTVVQASAPTGSRAQDLFAASGVAAVVQASAPIEAQGLLTSLGVASVLQASAPTSFGALGLLAASSTMAAMQAGGGSRPQGPGASGAMPRGAQGGQYPSEGGALPCGKVLCTNGHCAWAQVQECSRLQCNACGKWGIVHKCMQCNCNLCQVCYDQAERRSCPVDPEAWRLPEPQEPASPSPPQLSVADRIGMQLSVILLSAVIWLPLAVLFGVNCYLVTTVVIAVCIVDRVLVFGHAQQFAEWQHKIRCLKEAHAQRLRNWQEGNSRRESLRQKFVALVYGETEGRILGSPRDNWTHYGIGTGDGYVIELTNAGELHRSRVADVAGTGQQWLVVPDADYANFGVWPYSDEDTLARARDRLYRDAKPGYSLTRSNCEHFATEMRFGEKLSKQREHVQQIMGDYERSVLGTRFLSGLARTGGSQTIVDSLHRLAGGCMRLASWRL